MTTKQLLEKLPAPYNQEAIDACRTYHACREGEAHAEVMLNSEEPQYDPARTLMRAFVWEKSPQGYDYWQKLFDSIRTSQTLTGKKFNHADRRNYMH